MFECREEQPLDAFPRSTRSKDGRASWCKKCKNGHDNRSYSEDPNRKRAVRESNRRIRNNLARLVYEYLLEHPCQGCGEKDPVVLQFDHRDPSTKVAAISNLVRSSVSWRRVENEIAKCDVLCANCHTRRTASQFSWYNGRDAYIAGITPVLLPS